ncbi:Hypothetical predicted protein [Paramuricea clavata]|uniref:Uncharacterized protein n=1 Tax=Paramuricea clavata TaxID=317549 RepID=A0A6S7HUA9_PARCT|nr:Hypothetical predicted protein [Paramuricea clavata]
MAGLFCCRGLHTVRPHIPLIRFPTRFPLGSSTLSGKPSTVAPETRISNNNNELSINNIGVVDDSELPTRYRRAAILPEEILYVEQGGPD